MNTTLDMRRIMRRYELSIPMVRAIYSGSGGATIDCNDRTYNALADRDILHRVGSCLTSKGMEVLEALQVAQGS